MTIRITEEIKSAYRAFLDEQMDAFVDGTPILRRHTAPYSSNENCELIGFAAGFQAARTSGVGVGALPSDAITVNLVRLAGLDKHKARECEAIVRQVLAI